MSSPLAKLMPHIVWQISKDFRETAKKVFALDEQIVTLLCSDEKDGPAKLNRLIKYWNPILVRFLQLFVVDEAVRFAVPQNKIAPDAEPQEQFDSVGQYLRDQEAKLQAKGQTLSSEAYTLKYLWIRTNAKVKQNYYQKLLTDEIHEPAANELLFLALNLRMNELHCARLLDAYGYRAPSFRDAHEGVLQYALINRSGFVCYARMKSLYRLSRLSSATEKWHQKKEALQKKLSALEAEKQEKQQEKEEALEETRQRYLRENESRTLQINELENILKFIDKQINDPWLSLIHKIRNLSPKSSRFAVNCQSAVHLINQILSAFGQYLQMLPLKAITETIDTKTLEVQTVKLLSDAQKLLINIQEAGNRENLLDELEALENGRQAVTGVNTARRAALEDSQTDARTHNTRLRLELSEIKECYASQIAYLNETIRQQKNEIEKLSIPKQESENFSKKLTEYLANPLSFFADRHPFGVDGQTELNVLRINKSNQKFFSKATFQTSLSSPERTKKHLEALAVKRIVEQGNGFTTYMRILCQKGIREEVFIEALLAQKQGQVCRDACRRTVARLLLKIMEASDCTVKQAARKALECVGISAVDKEKEEKEEKKKDTLQAQRYKRYKRLQKLSDIANTNGNDKVEAFLTYMRKHNNRGSFIRHLLEVYSIPAQFSDSNLAEAIDNALLRLSHSLYQNKKADRLIYRLLKILGARLILQGDYGDGIVFMDDFVKLKAPSLQTIVDALLLGHIESSRMFLLGLALQAGEHPANALEEAQYPSYPANESEALIFDQAKNSINDAVTEARKQSFLELENNLKSWLSEAELFLDEKPLPAFRMNRCFAADRLVRDTLSAMDVQKIPDWEAEEKSKEKAHGKKKLELER